MTKRKQKRSARMSKRQRKQWLRIGAAALTVIAALVWARYGGQLRELGGLDGNEPPARSEHFRVVSWNLANFRGAASNHDLARMRAIIAELDPDVIAVQEVKDPAALAALLPEYELRSSAKGGRGHQHVGVAYRRDRVELHELAEHPELSIGGRVRPALSAYLGPRDGEGPDLWLVVVHLKAMPDGVELRRQQWPMLVEIAAQLRDPNHTDNADEDLLILGDFNSTGPRSAGRAGPAREQSEIATYFGPADLRRLSNATGCSAYYDGQRRDAWKEPSEIDLVWVRGLDEALDENSQLRSGTHCAAQRCEDARSTEAYPLHDYVFVSDHCPVVLDLRRADDD